MGKLRVKAVLGRSFLILMTIGSLVIVGTISSASAASGPSYPVMNTSETPPDGVWFRNSPHTADTSRITGLGVYANERVQLQCFAWGDAVGRYNDTLWYYVNNLSRPTNNGAPNQGYLNAHYINDGQNANVVNAGVLPCGAAAVPVAATPTVSLAQGPAAPAGYRYAIALAGFPANDAVSVSCRDSKSPGGFYSFTLHTDGSGRASTAGYCYSGDGPDHWVVANGVESNHVTWSGSAAPSGAAGSSGGSTSGGTTGGTGGNTAGGTAPGGSGSNLPTGGSLYYSPYNGPMIDLHVGPFQQFTQKIYAPSPATLTMDDAKWHHGDDCTASYAVPNLVGSNLKKQINTLAGWSYGRNGPVMFLSAQPSWISDIHYILLLDPGNVSDYTTGKCDTQYKDMSLAVLTWLNSNPQNRLVVLAGKLTADYGHPIDGRGHGGIQSVLFDAVKKNPATNNATLRSHVAVCNYDAMGHEEIWLNFKDQMNKPPITTGTCPAAPGYSHPLGWSP